MVTWVKRTNFLEVYRLIAEFPYAFTIRTKKGLDQWSLSERGTRNAYVHISRFPKLIKFIESNIMKMIYRMIYGGYYTDIHYQKCINSHTTGKLGKKGNFHIDQTS